MKDKVFELHRTVVPAEIDDLDHVNNVVYLQWVMDVAQAHWEVLSTAEMRSRVAWVVVRHELDYHRPARLGDMVTLRTWVGETTDTRSVRYVEVLNAAGKKMLSAKTIYCPIDLVSGKSIRITDDILACLT